MFPPNQGSSLFQDSSLNMTPRENCNISGYKAPNEISQDVPDREQTVLFVVKVSNHEDKIGTHGSPYKFSMLKSLKIRHLGKTLISPNF